MSEDTERDVVQEGRDGADAGGFVVGMTPFVKNWMYPQERSRR